MSTKTGIEWTDATWNPVTGCSKVSQGCKNCYALRDWARLSANPKTVYYGRDFTDVQTHMERLDQPLRWTKPRRIFVNSMSDLFHESVPFEFIDQMFATMAMCQQHSFQVLTKRADRMRAYLCDQDLEDRLTEIWRGEDPDKETWNLMLPLRNVWLGVSVEDQAAADERIPLLLQTPAAVRWISAEPLLGPVDLSIGLWMQVDGKIVNQTGRAPRLDWVVAGGESGPKARPSHPDWFRSLRDQCAAAGVAFLFKQWGEWNPGNVWAALGALAIRIEQSGAVHTWPPGFDPKCGDWCMHKVGKKAAGRLLDGVLHDAYPVEGTR